MKYRLRLVEQPQMKRRLRCIVRKTQRLNREIVPFERLFMITEDYVVRTLRRLFPAPKTQVLTIDPQKR